jgi:hypothetical protein
MMFRAEDGWYRGGGGLVTYGVFNLMNGNLVDSVESEQEALSILTVMIDVERMDPEWVGLVVEDGSGNAVASFHGEVLERMIHSGGGIAAVYA